MHLRHIPIAVLVMVLTAARAAVVAAVPGPGAVPSDLAAVLVIPLALGGAGGALVSLLGTAPSMNEALTLTPREAQGMRMAFRMVWPPAIATLGAAPMVLARVAVEDGDPGPPAAAALGLASAVVFVLVCGWVRIRDRIADWWKAQMETVMPTKSEADRA